MKQQVITLLKSFYRSAINHKKISIPVTLLILGGVIYLVAFKSTASSLTYQYGVAKRGSVVSTVSATGQVTPNSQVELKPKVNANVTGVYVKAGDRVKLGQVLFRLDATDAYKQVRDAKTSLAAASVSLLKLKNPKSIDIMSISDSIKKEEDSKKTEDIKVTTAYRNLLNNGLQAIPDTSYTTETPPTITGSYSKDIEGQIKLNVYQGGITGYNFSATGMITTSGQVNTSVAQPLGDTGLYIKWNSTSPTTNWIIDIPNKQSTSYLSNYTAWQTAITNREISNATSDRTIASLNQKLKDLTPSDDDLDVRSAMIQVEQRENALLDAQQTLSNYTITAPFDGVMASVTGAIGVSAVVASSNSSTALGTIVTDQKLAQVTLNEADIVKVKLGQKAKVIFDAVDNLSVDGSVVEINTLGTVTSGVVTYKVKVAFSSDDPRILPNMSVSLDILTDSKDDVIYVPAQAVKKDTSGYYVEKATDDNSGANNSTSTPRYLNRASSSIATIEGASTTVRRMRTGTSSGNYRRNITEDIPSSPDVPVKVYVTIGVQNDTQVEIISGIKEGDRVVIKKTTVSSSQAQAPSVTSLLRPQGAQNRGGAAVRAQ